MSFYVRLFQFQPKNENLFNGIQFKVLAGTFVRFTAMLSASHVWSFYSFSVFNFTEFQ